MTETIEIEDAALIMKCSVETVADNLRSGQITGVKFGVPWIIPRQAFFARLNELASEQAAEKRRAAKPSPVAPARAGTGRRNAHASFAPEPVGKV